MPEGPSFIKVIKYKPQGFISIINRLYLGVLDTIINIIFMDLFAIYICKVGFSISDSSPFIAPDNAHKDMCTTLFLVVCAPLVFIMVNTYHLVTMIW